MPPELVQHGASEIRAYQGAQTVSKFQVRQN